MVLAAVPHELLLIEHICWIQILGILLDGQARHHRVALGFRDFKLGEVVIRLLGGPQNCCHLLEIDVLIGCIGLAY